MNQILLSFLCGAAFIGGATATTVLVIIINGTKSKKDRDELMAYWRNSIEKHTEQIAILTRLTMCIESYKRGNNFHFVGGRPNAGKTQAPQWPSTEGK